MRNEIAPCGCFKHSVYFDVQFELFIKYFFLSITNKFGNPEHKLSSLLRSQSCHQSFFGASRSSRNSRKQLEIKRKYIFNHFLVPTSPTNFFGCILGCIFCCPKIFLPSHYLPLPKTWIFQKIYNWYVLLNKLFSLKNAIIVH